jgi:hypothetical protein
MYEIPREINTKTKIISFIYLSDIILLIISLAFASFTSESVDPRFSFLYMIFIVGMTLFLLVPSSENAGMKNYKTIYLLFRKDTNMYYSEPETQEIVMYE